MDVSVQNIITTILTGGFAGAGVAAFLGKKLVESSLKVSLKKYEHELSLKKDAIQTDLSLHAHQQNLIVSKYEEKKFEALEDIYISLISTSNARLNLKEFDNLFGFNEGDEFLYEYFKAYAHTFDEYDKAFKNITSAYKTIEENAIYIDAEIEREINTALGVILSHYISQHKELKITQKTAQKLYHDKLLSKNNAPLNFKQFYDTSSANWKNTANPVKHKIKSVIREILTPTPKNVT